MERKKDIFISSGRAQALPGIPVTSDFSILIQEGEVFVIQKEEEAMTPGQDLILTGFAGLAGSLILLREKRGELSGRFSDSFLDRCSGLEETLWRRPEGLSFCAPELTALEAVGEGGVFAALWKLADRFHRGMEVWLSDIPVKQETIEICEVFDCNPYELYGPGSFLLAADHGNQLVRELEKRGIAASVIGSVTGGRDRVIYTKEGKRFVTRPQPDGLYQINWEERT